MKDALVRIWKGKQTLEIFSLENHRSQKIAGGIVRGLINDRFFEMKYQMVLDSAWKFKSLKVQMLTEPHKILMLSVDNVGRWFNQNNEHLPDLDGCIDIDISATPFSNSLPLKRLEEQLAIPQQLKVVYINIPELEVSVVIQRYTRISENRYQYQNLVSGFNAELTIDEQGLVLSYHHFFQAIYSHG